ncbi:MAG: sensor histidine kinase [Hyphomicrobiaceae bacterium]
MATASLQPPLRRAVGSVARAEALISQVLRFAQGQAMEQQSVDLKQCLTDMQPMLRWIADNTMRVDVQIDAEVPPLFCSRFDLEAAILNVALNAHEAMPGAGTLSITAIPLRSGQAIEGVAISIADTGRGMSPQTRSRAMEPFFTTNATGGGNGLGLAMVRRFAREAGGDVAIESQLGIGTTVTLRLPIGSKR